MILKFRMLSDENDNFVRDLEVPHDMTLAGLHDFIIESLGYDNCMASFFAADDHWNRLREFTLMDMGEGEMLEEAPMAMDSITLAELAVIECDKLIYQFDLLTDRAYYLELVNAAEPNKDLTYPRVAFENASAPDQYDPDVVPTDDGSIFEEMMGEFGEYDGDDSYDDEY
ncbi:MAG: hypothetical protein J6R09_02640 [Alistipes sp.]|jgi:hypothetical protein|nr:hypothetical protein [Alistipes sp.]